MKSVFVLALALSTACVYAQHRSRNDDAVRWHAAPTRIISQELRFNNGNAHLVGTVYMPEKGDRLPAVVVLHAAMAATRDAALYRHLSEGLPALGIAVLIYDRRGSGQSTGSMEDISYETLADDGIAGQHALAKLPRIDPQGIGFWGLSQGGWLSVLAAGRSPDVAFAVSVSAPLVSAEQQMRFAIANRLLINGYSQADVEQMLATRQVWTDYLRGKASRSAALDAITKAEAKPWFQLTYIDTSKQLTTDPEHNSYRKEMDANPEAAVLKVKVPLLFIYGDSDPWIPVEESVRRLEALQKTQHNFEYFIVQNASHEMMFPDHETMEVDAKTISSDAPQAPAYFLMLGSWLIERTQSQQR
jgi:uncharacterized protein